MSAREGCVRAYRVGRLCRTHNPLKQPPPTWGPGSPTLLSPSRCRGTWAGALPVSSSASRRWGSRSLSPRCRHRTQSGLCRSLGSPLFGKHSGHTAGRSSSSPLGLCQVKRVAHISWRFSIPFHSEFFTSQHVQIYLQTLKEFGEWLQDYN